MYTIRNIINSKMEFRDLAYYVLYESDTYQKS